MKRIMISCVSLTSVSGWMRRAVGRRRQIGRRLQPWRRNDVFTREGEPTSFSFRSLLPAAD